MASPQSTPLLPPPPQPLQQEVAGGGADDCARLPSIAAGVAKTSTSPQTDEASTPQGQVRSRPFGTPQARQDASGAVMKMNVWEMRIVDDSKITLSSGTCRLRPTMLVKLAWKTDNENLYIQNSG